MKTTRSTFNPTIRLDFLGPRPGPAALRDIGYSKTRIQKLKATLLAHNLLNDHTTQLLIDCATVLHENKINQAFFIIDKIFAKSFPADFLSSIIEICPALIQAGVPGSRLASFLNDFVDAQEDTFLKVSLADAIGAMEHFEFAPEDICRISLQETNATLEVAPDLAEMLTHLKEKGFSREQALRIVAKAQEARRKDPLVAYINDIDLNLFNGAPYNDPEDIFCFDDTAETTNFPTLTLDEITTFICCIFENNPRREHWDYKWPYSLCSDLAPLYSSTEKAIEVWQTLTCSVENIRNRSLAPQLLKAGISLEATCNILNLNAHEMFDHLPHFLQLGCEEEDFSKIATNWKYLRRFFRLTKTRADLLSLISSLSFWASNPLVLSKLEQLLKKEAAAITGLSLDEIGQIILEVILAQKLSYALVLCETLSLNSMKQEKYQPLRDFLTQQVYDLKTRINVLADYGELLLVEEDTAKQELKTLVDQTATQLNGVINQIMQLKPTQKAKIYKALKINSSILKTLRRKLVSIALGRPLNRRETKLLANPQISEKILGLVRLVYNIRGAAGFWQAALCEQLLANLLAVLLLHYIPSQNNAEQKAITAMNKWLYELTKEEIIRMTEPDYDIQGNHELKERLIAAGFSKTLWEQGIELPVLETQPLTEAGKKQQIQSASFELVEIALMIGLTHLDGQPLTLDKADQLDCHEKAVHFVDLLKRSGQDINPELAGRMDYIVQTIAELEKQKIVPEKTGRASFRVTVKKDLFTEAMAGNGVPGCFNPRNGIHREMPFVHGAEVNAGFIQVFNDHGIQVANAVIVYEEQGAYVYPGYNGTAYDMDKIFAQALIELSRLVPAILLDSTSAGFNTLQKFAAREKRTFNKPATIFTSQYFDAETIDKENGTLTMKNDFYIITEESIKAQGGFDQPAVFAAEKDDKFPSISWQALANMFLQNQALRPFLAIIGNVRQKVQTEGQLVINDDFYAFISQAISEKVGQTDPDLEIEIADLVLDFLESQSWPMDIQTAA